MTFDIRGGVNRLRRRTDAGTGHDVPKAALLQFNSLLEAAKARYPESVDLQCLTEFPLHASAWKEDLQDLVARLADALDVVVDDITGTAPHLASKFGILRSDSQLAVDFAEYQAEGNRSGLVFFDIDNFKALNTKYTETVVDEAILAPFQHFLLDLLHLRGFGYSVGGDEFIAFLRNVAPQEVEAFAWRLCRDAAAHTFPVGSAVVAITLSIGYSCAPSDATSMPELRRLANLAENAAKSAGRNRVLGASAGAA